MTQFGTALAAAWLLWWSMPCCAQPVLSPRSGACRPGQPCPKNQVWGYYPQKWRHWPGVHYEIFRMPRRQGDPDLPVVETPSPEKEGGLDISQPAPPRRGEEDQPGTEKGKVQDPPPLPPRNPGDRPPTPPEGFPPQKQPAQPDKAKPKQALPPNLQDLFDGNSGKSGPPSKKKRRVVQKARAPAAGSSRQTADAQNHRLLPETQRAIANSATGPIIPQFDGGDPQPAVANRSTAAPRADRRREHPTGPERVFDFPIVNPAPAAELGETATEQEAAATPQQEQTRLREEISDARYRARLFTPQPQNAATTQAGRPALTHGLAKTNPLRASAARPSEPKRSPEIELVSFDAPLAGSGASKEADSQSSAGQAPTEDEQSSTKEENSSPQAALSPPVLPDVSEQPRPAPPAAAAFNIAPVRSERRPPAARRRIAPSLLLPADNPLRSGVQKQSAAETPRERPQKVRTNTAGSTHFGTSNPLRSP